MKNKSLATFRWLLLACTLLQVQYASANGVYYTYDDLNRLIRVERDDGTVIEYEYDATGNRTRHLVTTDAPPGTDIERHYLDSGDSSIELTGQTDRLQQYLDFGGFDQYSLATSLSGSITVVDNQLSFVNLPVGLVIAGSQFAADGVRFAINGHQVTFLGRPDQFTFNFGTTPENPAAGIARDLAATAQIFGATLPLAGQAPVSGTLSGTIGSDGTLTAGLAVVNFALEKPASQSSTDYDGHPDRAVDGITDGDYRTTASVTHTNQELHAWWQVDLGESETIDFIRIWNRTDCCAERLSDFYVLVSNQAFSSTSLQETLQQPGVWHVLSAGQAATKTDIPVHAPGRYVRIQLSGSNYLSLAEVEVFGFRASE